MRALSEERPKQLRPRLTQDAMADDKMPRTILQDAMPDLACHCYRQVRMLMQMVAEKAPRDEDGIKSSSRKL